MIFEIIRTWRTRREAMKEIAEIRQIETDRDVMRFKLLVERLEYAMAADQFRTAVSIWHEIRDHFYLQATRSKAVFQALLDLRELDDAERLVNEGLKRDPKQYFYMVELARVADLRGDNESALERWNTVRRRFPWEGIGYAQVAACLVKAGRMEEADAMLAQGTKQSPEDVFCLIEFARIAEARCDFESALLRWQHLREVHVDQMHPCYQNGTTGLAQCLRKMGRLDEAEALLKSFVEQFGSKEIPLMELAKIAEDRGDWEEAMRRWQRVKRSFPLLGFGYLGQINALRKAGKISGIEEILLEAIDRMPNEIWPLIDYAAAAGDSGDEAEIARRWLLVTERFPGYQSAYTKAATPGDDGTENLSGERHEARAAR